MKQIISNAVFCANVKLVLVNFVNDTTWSVEERVKDPQEWINHYDAIFKSMGITRKEVEEQGLVELEYSAPFVYDN